MKIQYVRRSGSKVGVFAALLLMASCSAVGDSIAEVAEEINASRHAASLPVAVGDTIQVTFPFKSAWDHETRVRLDGTASFNLIDDVAVAGLELSELDTRLTRLYREARSGQEDIDLTLARPTAGGGFQDNSDSGSGTGWDIYVVGEVRNPGPIALQGRALTLIEAIGAAGGHLKETANLRNTVLVRRLATNETRSWRLNADIYQWGDVPPIFLQPRDIVFVPNTAIDDVDIWVDQYIRRMLPFPYLIRSPTL